MSDQELVKPKRWEGKPFSFKFKFLVANYPELALCGFILGVVAPIAIAYRMSSFKGSRDEALKKFKMQYLVVRDDDPHVEAFRAEKEMGRQHFPKY